MQQRLLHYRGSTRPSPSFFVTLQYGKALYRTASDKKLGVGLGFEQGYKVAALARAHCEKRRTYNVIRTYISMVPLVSTRLPTQRVVSGL